MRPVIPAVFLASAAALLLALSAGPSLAQTIGSLDSLEDAFTAAVEPMAKKLSDLARNLVFSLMLIEMSWTL